MTTTSDPRRGLSVSTTAPADRRNVAVLSPAELAEIQRMGARWNLYATLLIFCTVPMLVPFLGLILGWKFIKRAKAYGNPAVLGTVALCVNFVGTLVWAIVCLRLVWHG